MAELDEAYKLAAIVKKTKMGKEKPEQLAALEKMSDKDVIVVQGQYDNIETMLGIFEIPHTLKTTSAFNRVKLRPEQLVFVNCPGTGINGTGVKKIHDFVKAGGYLITTDWALTIVERAFPGTIKHNGQTTSRFDMNVGIEYCCSHNHQGKNKKPKKAGKWKIHQASYPIEVIDTANVEVLIRSPELGKHYGDDPVAVKFSYGKGKVYHTISHYDMQMGSGANPRAVTTLMALFAGGKEVTDTTLLEAETAIGDIYASGNLFTEIINEKQKGMQK